MFQTIHDLTLEFLVSFVTITRELAVLTRMLFFIITAQSFPMLFVLPSPSVPPGSKASASPLSCTAPCTFSVLIPPDPYGNAPVASCTFFVLDTSVKAYRRSASPAATDSVDSRGLLNRTYLVTTSGVMHVRCDFWRASPNAQIFEIPGSPFFLTVANAVAVPSKTQVIGGGIIGGAAGMRAEIIIMPKDAFDNIVPCTAVCPTQFTLFLKLEVPLLSVIESGSKCSFADGSFRPPAGGCGLLFHAIRRSGHHCC